MHVSAASSYKAFLFPLLHFFIYCMFLQLSLHRSPTNQIYYKHIFFLFSTTMLAVLNYVTVQQKQCRLLCHFMRYIMGFGGAAISWIMERRRGIKRSWSEITTLSTSTSICFGFSLYQIYHAAVMVTISRSCNFFFFFVMFSVVFEWSIVRKKIWILFEFSQKWCNF